MTHHKLISWSSRSHYAIITISVIWTGCYNVLFYCSNKGFYNCNCESFWNWSSGRRTNKGATFMQRQYEHHPAFVNSTEWLIAWKRSCCRCDSHMKQLSLISSLTCSGNVFFFKVTCPTPGTSKTLNSSCLLYWYYMSTTVSCLIC